MKTDRKVNLKQQSNEKLMDMATNPNNSKLSHRAKMEMQRRGRL